MTELQRRTDPKYLGTKKLLTVGAPEYENLNDKDKEALKHIVKAATYLENIEFQIDDHHNIPFKKFWIKK